MNLKDVIAIAGLSCLLMLDARPAAGGDIAAGEALFDGKGGCHACHSIQNHGGALGPDLSEIGIRRTPESLYIALTDPSAEIYQDYFTVIVETKTGEKIEGIALNEDDLSIQVRDTSGDPRSFLKVNLKEVRREERSLMPSYRSRLSDVEIDNLVAYLRTLKGTPAVPGQKVRRTRGIAPVSENINFLNRPGREAEERTESLMNALQITPGSAVADIGAGTGFFTWRLAQAVGLRGKVIAVEIQQKMLDLAAETVKKYNLSNVEFVIGGEGDPRLPEGSLDLVFIANAYHEFSQPEAMMAHVRRSLKPGGRLVVLEYAKENAFVPAGGLHKMSLEEMRTEIEPMGFELDRVLDFLPIQHGLIFTKRP